MPVTVIPVLPGQTKDQGRQNWNTSDDNLKVAVNALETQQAAHVGEGHDALYYTKAQIDTSQGVQDAALTTHKASADHDARYIAASVLSSIMRLTTDQVIDGIKTFVKKIIVKVADPAIELLHSDATNLARVRGGIAGGNSYASFDVGSGANWKTILFGYYNDTFVNFSNHDVQSKGKKLATEEFVQLYQGNGSVGGGFVYNGAIDVPNMTVTTVYPFTRNGIPDLFPILKSCTLVRVSITNELSANGATEGFITSIALPVNTMDELYLIAPKIETYNDSGFSRIKLKIYKVVYGGGITETLLYEQIIGGAFTSGVDDYKFFVGLLFQ